MRLTILLTTMLLLVCQDNCRADAVQRKRLTVVCEVGQVYPYIIGDGERFSAPRPGIAVEMVRMVADRLGLELELKRLPWKRCLEVELKSGHADGAFQSSYLPEREAYGHYPMKGGQPNSDYMLFTQTYSLYKQKKSRIGWDGKKLVNFRGVAGIPPGYSIGHEMKKMGVPYESSSSLSILKKLASGRLQMAALLESEGDRLMEGNGSLAAVIEKMSPPLIVKPYYLMLSHQFVRDYPDLAERIWTTVREVRLREYPRLLREYEHHLP
jgi:polar amino acid transport system substrate-binding protein